MDAARTGRPLYERDRELGRLAAQAAAARGGHGALVLVEGPAGIGKTRLLHELVGDEAVAGGFTVLRAWGGELEAGHPFGVARQLLEPAVVGHDALLVGPAALAAPLVGMGDHVAPSPASDGTFPLLHGLHWLVVNLAARGPLLLVVDDAHWADPGSLRWLAYLGPRLAGLPVLAVVAARGRTPGAAGELLAEVASHAAEILQPAPLTPAAAREIVGDAFGSEPEPAFADACQDASGGNPFLLSELVGALLVDGAPPTGAAAARVRELRPATITQAALARMGPLSGDARALARVAALLGDGTALGTAAALAGLTDADAARAADALAAAAILQTGRPLRFVHALVCNAVADDIPFAQRAELHARAARWLHAAGAGPEVVAAHLLNCDPAADAWVVERLREAAARADAAGAPETAAGLLRRALEEPPDDDARPAVLAALGAAQARSPHEPDAIANLERAVALSPAGVRLPYALELGQALLMAGRAAEAVAVFDRELAELDPSLADLGQVLQGALLVASYSDPEARERIDGRPWRFPGRRPPESVGDRVWLLIETFEATMRGDAPSAGVAAGARDALAGGSVLELLSADSPAYYLGTNTLLYADAYDDARAAYDAALEQARRRGSLRAFAMASCWRAALDLFAGDVDGARADAEATLAAVADGDLGLGQPVAASFLADALLEAGEIDAAAATLAGASRDGALGDSILRDYLFHSEGRLRLAQGRPADAADAFARCGERQTAWGVGNAAVLPWRSGRALALAAADDGAEEATALVADELDRARRWAAPRPLGIALRRAGLVAGDVEPLRESVTVLADSPARLEHAHSLVALGAALRRAGHRTEAREPLRDGLAIARSCGGAALAAHAHDELTATGVSVRKMLHAGTDALTPSERRVAQMAADGMSNRDIAAALFVTIRTVEAHLHHTYAKLGVPGRRELAAALL